MTPTIGSIQILHFAETQRAIKSVFLRLAEQHESDVGLLVTRANRGHSVCLGKLCSQVIYQSSEW